MQKHNDALKRWNDLNKARMNLYMMNNNMAMLDMEDSDFSREYSSSNIEEIPSHIDSFKDEENKE